MIDQKFKVEQESAKVGMTGYTLIHHIHFQVFVFTGNNIQTDFDTMKIDEVYKW
ncbi:hypothetical protein BH23THE1_BH23THE1_31350 [soil metagenome]